MWEFDVPPAHAAEFVRVYGSAGDWARLFQRDPGYRGTELLKAVDHPGRYLTVDRWASREDFRRFREAFRAEYLALDTRCEALTAAERLVGDYVTQE